MAKSDPTLTLLFCVLTIRELRSRYCDVVIFACDWQHPITCSVALAYWGVSRESGNISDKCLNYSYIKIQRYTEIVFPYSLLRTSKPVSLVVRFAGLAEMCSGKEPALQGSWEMR